MLVPSKSIQVSKTAASQYMLETSRGETALVNTADELIKFDDYLSFVSLSAINTEGSVDDDDELSFVREKPMEYSPAAASAIRFPQHVRDLSTKMVKTSTAA